MMEKGETMLPPLKRFAKIPIYIVEEHNDALQFIYSAIGGKKLPVEGTTLVHLDSHPDMLIDRNLKGAQARAGRELLPLLQIENWIVPAVAAGHIERVVWLRPPWAEQFSDGTRVFHVGDDPDTGLLRVDSKEPYYLSDALYSSKLTQKRKLIFTVAGLSDPSVSAEVPIQSACQLANSINITQPYVLDIDLDFFSTGNPFKNIYQNIKLYDLLEPIFEWSRPADDSSETVEKVNDERNKQLEQLETLFQLLEKEGSLASYQGKRNELFNKVADLVEKVNEEAEFCNVAPDWWVIYAAGCTRDQGGLPYHISTEETIRGMVNNALVPLLQELSPPVLITIARSVDDGYCPSHQVDLIQSLVLDALKGIFQTDDPSLHYLTVETL